MERELSAMILANDEQAFVELCGISLLERSLRILQRAGFERVTIVSAIPDLIQQHLATPSWARSQIEIAVVPQWPDSLATRAGRVLVLRGDTYYDARLLEALSACAAPAILVDSAPPARLLALLEQNPRTRLGFNCGAELQGGAAGEVEIVDVQKQPTYLVNLRRHVRPLWFPAPRPHHRALAENLLLDAAQNGTLDLPAKVHAPIETWIIARLCRTGVTPNQITLFTAAVSLMTAFLFARGNLLAGTILALIVGVLDGLDGKQARVKVETTELGKREHLLDYALELSWWTALAYQFSASGPLVLLVVSDLFDRLAKKSVKQKTGRHLDDLSLFDRAVRLVGGRRNIYIWMFALGLLAGIPDQAFLALCLWGAVTAAVHVLRAIAILCAK